MLRGLPGLTPMTGKHLWQRAREGILEALQADALQRPLCAALGGAQQ